MVSLDSEQLEQLKAIGTFLGEVREEEGRTLEDIATKTYIPLRLLRAIEAGQEQILPEPVFVQGFIRRYGDALGLDGNELSKRFPVNAVPVISAFTAHQEAKTGLPDPEPGAAYVPPATNVWQPAELPSSRPPYLLIGGIALAVLAGLGSVVLPLLKPSTPIASAPSAPSVKPAAPVAAPLTDPVPSPEVSAAKETPIAASPITASPITASPTPAATAIASPVDPNSPVSIDVKVSDRSWVQVVVDGAVEYEGILETGAQQSWSGKESIIISSGNAGAVSVAFNKGVAQTMGKLGAIEEKTYTAKGVQ
ncbi:MAG: helix-turn-helix domain-containing protein [Leptolyngbyaceae cyanobacterium CSU_1_4]|nr:helix-turn-helix domain-containing protein [Leptolyngbyaceae cyanobacterium CSU_1_4]